MEGGPIPLNDITSDVLPPPLGMPTVAFDRQAFSWLPIISATRKERRRVKEDENEAGGMVGKKGEGPKAWW